MAGKRKQKSSEGEGGGGAPGWMVTFGDLMSLLLTFFVLLLSFSSIQQVEFEKALGSLKGALGVLPKEQSVIFRMKPYYPRLSEVQNAKFRKKLKELQRLIKEENLTDQIYLELNDIGILIRIESPVLFDLGDASIKPQAYPLLNKVLDMFKDWDNNIRIEGHTDDLPIHTSRFPSNWELSTARALSVLQYFVKSGQVDPKRLSAAGYGEYHPLLPNTTEENRAKNRRVEIYVEREKPKITFREEII